MCWCVSMRYGRLIRVLVHVPVALIRRTLMDQRMWTIYSQHGTQAQASPKGSEVTSLTWPGAVCPTKSPGCGLSVLLPTVHCSKRCKLTGRTVNPLDDGHTFQSREPMINQRCPKEPQLRPVSGHVAEARDVHEQATMDKSSI